MHPESAKRLRILASAISVLLLLVVLAAGWFYWRVRASLPPLDGSRPAEGLSAAVAIERDAQGVPTIRAANRADAARALGWVHGQDRFFQMDLLRRSAAGELSEMFGPRALPRDRAMRAHGFRQIAAQSTAALSKEHRAVLDAYTAGVNEGLASLGEKPFEYLILRETPRAWQPEDSILVIHAMMVDLQDESGRYERTLMTLRDQFGAEGLAFFAPLQTPADAALDGSTAPLAPVPGPAMLDLRVKAPPTAGLASRGVGGNIFAELFPSDEARVQGSNAFALPGVRTASGAGLLANDMHLDLSVPNTWYRVSLEYGGRKVTGVTLPGTPAIAAGSNGSVAWGLTASYADTGDLVIIQTNGPDEYVVGAGAQLARLERRGEIIHVKGGRDVPATYSWTRWGPIIGATEAGRPLAYRWTAHDPAAANLDLLDMETTRDVRAAVEVAHRAGMPSVNMLAADRDGAVAWTIAGRLPNRVGYDGRLPTTWAYGDRRWDGFLPESEVPVVVVQSSRAADSPLWSANQRMIGGEAFAKIGDGGYPRPDRAAQIRDALGKMEHATPRDLLAVQLDDRALFLARWRDLLMNMLTPAAINGHEARGQLRALVEKWEGRASVEAVGYRLVREFRSAVYARVFPPIFTSCFEAFPDFEWQDLQLEGAMWALLREKPAHLLDPQFLAWDDLLLAAADEVLASLDRQNISLAKATWGLRNRARIRHPFSGSFPGISAWTDMPADPLPGDTDMPRVQTPGHGASERLIVAPGREEEGIFQMPGGQSGHPLSPFYRAGHAAWVRGDPAPFLPGKTAHTLTLTPR